MILKRYCLVIGQKPNPCSPRCPWWTCLYPTADNIILMRSILIAWKILQWVEVVSHDLYAYLIIPALTWSFYFTYSSPQVKYFIIASHRSYGYRRNSIFTSSSQMLSKLWFATLSHLLVFYIYSSNGFLCMTCQAKHFIWHVLALALKTRQKNFDFGRWTVVSSFWRFKALIQSQVALWLPAFYWGLFFSPWKMFLLALVSVIG